jgi:hypothetical protein
MHEVSSERKALQTDRVVDQQGQLDGDDVVPGCG